MFYYPKDRRQKIEGGRGREDIYARMSFPATGEKTLSSQWSRT